VLEGINGHQIAYNCAALYEATIMATKVAILLEWTRTFVQPRTRNSLWWTSVVLLALNAAFHTSSILVAAFACGPHEGIWNRTVPRKCLDTKIVMVISSATNLVSSFHNSGPPAKGIMESSYAEIYKY
jgi:hypothetical protein